MANSPLWRDYETDHCEKHVLINLILWKTNQKLSRAGMKYVSANKTRLHLINAATTALKTVP